MVEDGEDGVAAAIDLRTEQAARLEPAPYERGRDRARGPGDGGGEAARERGAEGRQEAFLERRAPLGRGADEGRVEPLEASDGKTERGEPRAELLPKGGELEAHAIEHASQEGTARRPDGVRGGCNGATAAIDEHAVLQKGRHHLLGRGEPAPALKWIGQRPEDPLPERGGPLDHDRAEVGARRRGKLAPGRSGGLEPLRQVDAAAEIHHPGEEHGRVDRPLRHRQGVGEPRRHRRERPRSELDAPHNHSPRLLSRAPADKGFLLRAQGDALTARRSRSTRRRARCEAPPMDLQLVGKRAVVSGSTAGIGYAIAAALAREGAAVVVNGRTAARVDEAVRRIRAEHAGATVEGVACDLGTRGGADRLFDAVPAADILVNNLGIFEPRAFVDIPDEDWLRFFEVNVLSGIRLSRHYLAGMVARKWGRVVFISSESAVQIPAEMIHYGMTKTAQVAVARGLAESVAGTGVTVNSVLPGPTSSEGVTTFVADMGRSRGVDAATVEREFFQTVRPSSLIQRFATPDEVAAMVAYVCSSLASATTGAALRVDGGVVRAIL